MTVALEPALAALAGSMIGRQKERESDHVSVGSH
jgi:hypothetical protein